METDVRTGEAKITNSQLECLRSVFSKDEFSTIIYALGHGVKESYNSNSTTPEDEMILDHFVKCLGKFLAALSESERIFMQNNLSETFGFKIDLQKSKKPFPSTPPSFSMSH
jgi:hypothetical protein